MKSIFVFVMVLFFSLPVVALEQLDVVGLIPDVSTAIEFEAIAKIGGDYSSGPERNGGIEIGGYIMPCKGDFSSGKLDSLVCYMGREFSSNDSNMTIYDVLKAGFTRKFGIPDVDGEIKKSVGTGLEEVPTVVWTDKHGNGLMIKSMDGDVETGSLHLFSHKLIKRFNQKEVLKEQRRKF